MRIRDYFRLASAGLWQQKGQTMKIILITGTIFIFVLTCGFLTWGAIDTGIEKINQPAWPQILTAVELNMEEYKMECENTMDFEVVKENIRKYNGKVIEQTGTITTNDGELNVLPWGVIQQAIEVQSEDVPKDAIPIIIPTRMAIEWLELLGNAEQPTFNEEDGTFDFGIEATVETIQKVREQALGKVILSPSNEKYFVVGFLPSNVSSTYTLNTNNNFLNLFIDRTTVGNSKKPIVASNEAITDDTERRIWATFENTNDAYNFYKSMENDNRYTVSSPFGYEYDPKWSYGATENLFKLVAIVFGVLAVIVNIITLLRIIRRESATMSLYYMMGAKPGQIRLVQGIRMLILCLLTSIFVVMVSCIVCLTVNLLNAEKLAEAYALGFGVSEQMIMLFSWRWEVLALIGAILLTSQIPIILSWKIHYDKV